MQPNKKNTSLIRLLWLYRYYKLGETSEGIKALEDLSGTILKKNKLLSLLAHFEATDKEHAVIRLIEMPYFKVSMHSIAPHYQIARHAHSGFFSLTYLHKGAITIKQQSLSSADEVFERLLKPQQSCAGLLNLRNIHTISSLKQHSVFLSIRIAKSQLSLNRLKRFYYAYRYRYALLSGFAIILSSTFSPSLLATDKEHFIKTSHSESTLVKQQLELANQLRTGKGRKKDYYEAAQLYEKASRQGNAEAQYWLGVMCFDGLGITDDRDDAMHWLALSSDQNYPPAKKLLHHLLNTDDVSDC
jgi:hypothetical protein